MFENEARLVDNQMMTYVQNKLEIWGKAQRESAGRPKSDWGKLGGKEGG